MNKSFAHTGLTFDSLLHKNNVPGGVWDNR